MFLDSSSTPATVALAGEEFMLALHGATSTTLSLNTHIHQVLLHESDDHVPDSYNRLMQLMVLPPMLAAAREHSWRVYHQVQSWPGNDPLRSDWGRTWLIVPGFHSPVSRKWCTSKYNFMQLHMWIWERMWLLVHHVFCGMRPVSCFWV